MTLHNTNLLFCTCKTLFMRHCRAYKLGKGRWSYNQCELNLVQQGAAQEPNPTGVMISEAIHISSRAAHQPPHISQVIFNQRLRQFVILLFSLWPGVCQQRKFCQQCVCLCKTVVDKHNHFVYRYSCSIAPRCDLCDMRLRCPFSCGSPMGI